MVGVRNKSIFLTMDIKRLKYFVAVLDRGSISGAASAAGVSQQAISRSLQLLEEEVGEVLLARTRTGVAPTERGRCFADFARYIVSEFDKGLNELITGRSKETPLNVGLSFSLAISGYAQIIADAFEKIGHRRLNFLKIADCDVAQMLSSGQLDAAFYVYGGNQRLVQSFTTLSRCEIYVGASELQVAIQASESAAKAASFEILPPVKQDIVQEFVYEGFVDAVGEYLPSEFRSDCAISLLFHLKQCQKRIFFVATDRPQTIQEQCGIILQPVQWMHRDLSFGIALPNKVTPTFDATMLVEYINRAIHSALSAA